MAATRDKRRTKRPNGKTVSPEDFIRAWQISWTIAEVGRKLSMEKGTVRARVALYRHHNVPLKAMLAERPILDWQKLRTLALKCDDGLGPF